MSRWMRVVVSAASLAVSASWTIAPSGRLACLVRSQSTADPASGGDLETVGKKRGRGRPRKDPADVEAKKVSQSKKPSATKKKPKKLSLQEEEDIILNREIKGPTLTIVTADGLPGDTEALDWIRSQCRELYGDTLCISEHVLNDDGEDEEKDDDDAEAVGDNSQDPEVVDVGSDEDEESASDGKLEKDVEVIPYDPELLDLWMESRGGVFRIAYRRSKKQLVFSEEVKAQIMSDIADYMDPEAHLTFEVFRDPLSYPELS